MKVNPRIRYYLAKYTCRVNLFFAIAFIVTLASCYVDYLHKLEKYPRLPWYAMFLKVEPKTSWDVASPFKV